MLSTKTNNNNNNNNSGVGCGNGGGTIAVASIVAGKDDISGMLTAQKWFQQQQALFEVCALPISALTNVQKRRKMSNDGSAQILRLIEELQQAFELSLGKSSAMKATTSKSEIAAAAIKIVRENSGLYNNNDTQTKTSEFDNNLFNAEDYQLTRNIDDTNSLFFCKECGLDVGMNELRLCDGYSSTSYSTTTTTTTSTTTNNNNNVASGKRLQPLKAVLYSLKDLCQIPAHNKHAVSAAATTTTTTTTMGNKYENETKSILTIVQSLQNAIEETMRIVEHGYAQCAGSSDDIAAWGEWIHPLVRMLAECIRAVPLDSVIEEPRERLRRVSFDVKEKQREQDDAVNDGDMVRSEKLYFEKVALLEGMNPIYEQLEKVIMKYKEESADEPLKKVNLLVNDLTKRFFPLIMTKEKNLSKRCVEDIERILKKREEVLSARNQRLTEFDIYIKNWEQCFQLNQRQQDACLQAIEELEQRLRYLTDERTFLVEDRIEAIIQHRQQEDVTNVFTLFANKQEELLRKTLQHIEQSQSCAQLIHDTVLSGYQNLNRYLKNNILNEVEKKLLETRKERLEQFRGLYLTLGELQFKKERHMEELDKRIDHYHLQQEIAMDTFNPRAKEYSKAKKELLEIKQTMEEQVKLISQKAAKQLEEFKPTEKLLIAAGVRFKHPTDDLAEMNARRTQKLLEYHTLMSSIKDDKKNTAEENDAESNSSEF